MPGCAQSPQHVPYIDVSVFLWFVQRGPMNCSVICDMGVHQGGKGQNLLEDGMGGIFSPLCCLHLHCKHNTDGSSQELYVFSGTDRRQRACSDVGIDA